jgi:hypothetical protein
LFVCHIGVENILAAAADGRSWDHRKITGIIVEDALGNGFDYLLKIRIIPEKFVSSFIVVL